MTSEYSPLRRVLFCTAIACLIPICAAAQAPRGATPASVRVLDELIERLTDQPLYRHNAVRLLLDGPETHTAMLDAIASAEHHVHLETYIIADDEIGRRFADALVRKARQGVTVRLLFDSIGSRGNDPEFFARLEEQGVQIREFNPPNPVEDRNPFDIPTRDHRKLLIVDGRVAYTGGINIDRNYARPSLLTAPDGVGATGWRDTHVEISGPAVAGFQRLFVDMWEQLDVELEEPLYEPQASELEVGDTRVRVLPAIGGDEGASAIWVAYQAAAKVASERIWITQSYFAPDDVFTAAIVEAAARGVDVRILVAGFSDSDLLINASRSYYSALLEAGVRVFESQEQILHAKTMVVDGYWSTIGSSNLDYMSFLHNHEVNAVIVDARFAASMEDLFLADVENGTEIALARWRERSLWQRAKEFWSQVIRYRL